MNSNTILKLNIRHFLYKKINATNYIKMLASCFNVFLVNICQTLKARPSTIYHPLPFATNILTETRHTVWLRRPLASAKAHIAPAVATSATAAVVGVPVFIVFRWRKAHWRTGRTRQLTVAWNLLQWRFVVHHSAHAWHRRGGQRR